MGGAETSGGGVLPAYEGAAEQPATDDLGDLLAATNGAKWRVLPEEFGP